jgi:hypothetical protein
LLPSRHHLRSKKSLKPEQQILSAVCSYQNQQLRRSQLLNRSHYHPHPCLHLSLLLLERQRQTSLQNRSLRLHLSQALRLQSHHLVLLSRLLSHFQLHKQLLRQPSLPLQHLRSPSI